MFGISEQNEGLPRSVRWRNYFDRISSVISELESDSITTTVPFEIVITLGNTMELCRVLVLY